MRKTMIVGIVLVIGLFLATTQVFAGGRAGFLASKEIIGTPPEAMERTSNITRTKGDEKLLYPIVDFFSRVADHYIPAGDKKPGPGYGVPEGHNIGNAPQPRIVGKRLDRSGKGDGGPVADLFRRIGQYESSQRENK